MESIVTIHQGSPVISSLKIAEGVGLEHRAVLQLISTHQEDLGTSAFEMRKSGGRPQKIILLNEEQTTFLLTLMKNSKPVVAFKKRLVRAFFEMREALAKQEAEASKALPSAAEPVETREERAKRLTRERQHRYYAKKREKRLAARALPPPTLPASDERLHRLLTDYRYRREAMDAVRKLFQLLPPRTTIPNLDVQKIADGLILEAMRHCEFRFCFSYDGQPHVSFVSNDELNKQRGRVCYTNEEDMLRVARNHELDGGMPLDILKKVVQAGFERLAMSE